MVFFMIVLFLSYAESFCEHKKTFEVGSWNQKLKHLHTDIIVHKPSNSYDGLVHVYENQFPGHTIEYINIENLAARSCGAEPTIKSGGLKSDSILIILHAARYDEIRTVIDIWGRVKSNKPSNNKKNEQIPPPGLNNIKSIYLSTSGRKGVKDTSFYRRMLGPVRILDFKSK